MWKRIQVKKPRNYRKVRSSGLWAKDRAGNWYRRDRADIFQRGLLVQGPEWSLHYSMDTMLDVYSDHHTSWGCCGHYLESQQGGEPLSNAERYSPMTLSPYPSPVSTHGGLWVLEEKEGIHVWEHISSSPLQALINREMVIFPNML